MTAYRRLWCYARPAKEHNYGRNPSHRLFPDPLWARITEEAEDAVRREPLMGGFIHACVLHHRSLAKALSYRFSAKLFSNEMPAVLLREIAEEAYGETPELLEIAQADLAAVVERDPACHRFMQPSSTSRATRRFKRTAWPIGFGFRNALIWPISFRCG